MTSRRTLLAAALLPTLALAEPSHEDRLHAGEIFVTSEKVAGTDMPLSQLEGVVEAPPEAVWAIVSACGNYAKHFQRILASEELTREGNVVTCKVTTDMPFPLSDLTSINRAVHTVEPGKRWKREWKLVEGDYEFNQGSWELTPFRGDPKRTLARYRLHAQPKVGLPQGIIRAAQGGNLPNVMNRLRELTKGR
ncbi:MAG: hypothetical protein RL653_3449 [Pseudomonadota bacterium]|jgi:hypothetical protein